MSNGGPLTGNPNRFQHPTGSPNLNQDEQLNPADFDNIVQMPINAVANAMSVMFQGETGVIDGLRISLKNNNEVYLSSGYGVITTLNPNDSNEIEGSFIVVNNEDSKYLFTIPLLPVGAKILVYLQHHVSDTTPQLRTFINADGSKTTRQVNTQKIHDFTSGWMANKLLPSKIYNYLFVATITVGSTTVPWIIEQWPTKVLTLYQHQNAVPLDHANGSVKQQHIDPAIMGNYIEGTDMTIKAMSTTLENMKGNMASPAERIKVVIDENGNIDNDAIADAVEQLVRTHLSGLTDGQGNLSSEAIDTAKDDAGRPLLYKIGVKAGQVDGNSGKLPIPEGFTLGDCVFIVSIALLTWDQQPGSSVEIHCSESNGVCQCYAIVNHDNGKKYWGTANCLAIGIKPRQN